MLSAFLDYRGRCKGQARAQLDHLYMIVHTHESTFVAGNQVIRPQEMRPLPTRPFDAQRCERCRTGRGGYAFKWYHQRWRATYDRLRRENTWHPDAA